LLREDGACGKEVAAGTLEIVVWEVAAARLDQGGKKKEA
jgi:hypothetical protein